MNLLIVEDDKAQLESYEDAIVSFSNENHFLITPTYKTNLKDGMDAIRANTFDAAVLDLKLSSSTMHLEGLELVDAINGKLRIPIFIVSGSIAQVDIEENALFKKRVRTDRFKDILNEIVAVYNTGITKLLRPGGRIDQMLTTIFWKHLANDLETWKKHKNSDTLLRYITSHLQEYLDIDTEGIFEDYHPFEVYIKPPIKQNPHTGDLIKYEGGYYLILTPACDIVLNRKKTQRASSKI